MPKFILAFGIITILAAFSIQGWAGENPLYGCYQDKSEEVRGVKAPGDCLSSETVVGLNQNDPEVTPSQKARNGLREKLRDFDYMSHGSMFGDGSFHIDP